MKILLIGFTGMLGQALNQKLNKVKAEVFTVARTSGNYKVDLYIESDRLFDIISQEKPDIVINCAALVNLRDCEENPGKAYIINARFPSILEEACRQINSYLVQISTDHYYTNKNKKQHKESEQVLLLNEYARTKYAGENFVLTYHNSLVVRTNIVGFRNKKNAPTFIEWVIKTLQLNKTITGYDDYYTSSIDVYQFANILIELINKKATGVINVASKDVLSKYEFIYRLASQLGKQEYVLKGSMGNQEIKRADSLGLDVTQLQNIINEDQIPTSEQVINMIFKKYKKGAFYEL